MCIVLVLLGCFRNVPLVVVHGRDEDLDRAATPCQLHEDGLLAGLDSLRGGTWAGLCTRTGDLVVLTNVRTADRCARELSRGQLVLDLLRGQQMPCAQTRCHLRGWSGVLLTPLWRLRYGPFNVLRANVFSDDIEVRYECRPDEEDAREGFVDQELKPGVHALSNSFLDDTSWPKVRFLLEGGERIVRSLGADYEPDAEQPVDQWELVRLLSDLFTEERDVLGAEDEDDGGHDTLLERLKRRVFVTRLQRHRYGTTSHTAALVTAHSVHVLARSVQHPPQCGDAPTVGPWQSWSLPRRQQQQQEQPQQQEQQQQAQ